MPEYIEREALIHNLKQFALEQLTPLIESLIQKQPAADVADVIMCKDCEHFTDEYECFNDPYCHEYDRYVSKNDYCSRAKDKWKRNKFNEAWSDKDEYIVKLVRCKDCKHLMFSYCYGECRRNHLGIVKPDDYCSYGERKEGDGE